jgi:hypothetical protein
MVFLDCPKLVIGDSSSLYWLLGVPMYARFYNTSPTLPPHARSGDNAHQKEIMEAYGGRAWNTPISACHKVRYSGTICFFLHTHVV